MPGDYFVTIIATNTNTNITIILYIVSIRGAITINGNMAPEIE